MNPSIKAYQTVCKILGTKAQKITETLPEIPKATLVIVPDELFDYEQLFKLARTFGEDQPYKTYIYEDLYKLYSPEQLSGKVAGKGYRQVYIPQKYNVKSGTVSEQRKIKGQVPSVLEAITHWFLLREQGEKLNSGNTDIRHFDLPEQRVDDWSYVPGSFVRVDGKPYLRYSGVQYDGSARLLVGENSTLTPPTQSLTFEIPEIIVNGVRYVPESGGEDE